MSKEVAGIQRIRLVEINETLIEVVWRDGKGIWGARLYVPPVIPKPR